MTADGGAQYGVRMERKGEGRAREGNRTIKALRKRSTKPRMQSIKEYIMDKCLYCIIDKCLCS